MIRLWNKALLDGECFTWGACKSPAGYGYIQFNGKKQLAHRVAYSITIGAIPDGLTVDHLCRNKSCINPMHMELVTLRENIKRRVIVPKTHCKRGHEFTNSNTYIEGNGRRHCRTCHANSLYRGIRPRYKYKEEV